MSIVANEMRILKAIARKLFSGVVFPIIRFLQSSKVHKYGNMPLKWQPIFIIGAPRTGSTILYQALTNYFDVLYIDNLVCMCHKSLFSGFWISNKIYGSKPHKNFQSEYGNTARFGGHAPSECGEFWYRWLPRERHFIDDHEISDEMVDNIRREITAVSNYFDRPLLFKNLNAGQRLRLLYRCFPEAKFIYVQRRAETTIRSIMAGRRKVGAGPGQWWGIMPPDYASLLVLPELAMVKAQIERIEEQIEKDIQRFTPQNVRDLHYDDFSAGLVESVGTWLCIERRDGGTLPIFKNDM